MRNVNLPAGNDGNLTNSPVSSPGKALNAVTVGNAITKSSAGTTALNAPYNLSTSSSFGVASYLPNKPDITAPGSYVNYAGTYPSYSTPPSGTSFSAPVVTGVIAQMMQANPSLKANPTAVKSKLLLAADSSKVTTSNNLVAADSQHLREKSGAGFLDAVKSVNYARSSIGMDLVIDSNTEQKSQEYYFYAGQKVRAVMAYDKKHTNTISSASQMDMIDFYIKRSNGNAVATSVSNRNNIRIIEHEFAADGYYYFSASPYQLINSTGRGGVNVHISFQTDPATYNVIYNANAEGETIEGILPTDNNLYAANDIVNVKPQTMTKPGYWFKGWATTPNGIGTIYNAAGSNRSFAMPAENVTLYAQWQDTFVSYVNGLRLTFKVLSGGANPTVQVGTGGYGTSVQLIGGHLVIPETIQYGGMNYTVTAIGDWAFTNCDATGVTFPNTLKEIGFSAFSGCDLGELTLPEGLLELHTYAFSGTHLTSVNIPESMEVIGSGAFAWGSGLTNVTIPNADIGEYAFESNSLQSVTLGRNVTTIGDRAFFGCNDLLHVYNEAAAPQVISKNVFSDATYGGVLTVPPGSMANYASADYWKDFSIIK